MKKILAILFCFFCLTGSATHLRCGHIALSHVSGLTYEVRIIVYTNTNSPVRFSDGTLNFGDGTTQQTPTVENTIFSSGVGTVSYAINHTFPAIGNYTITYSERNLAAGILNISNSVNTPFYLETSAFLDTAMPYFSPEFLAPPIFKQPAGKQFSLSHIAIDQNDNQLRYELVSPLDPKLTSFSMPENLAVNYYNGLVTWDTKFKEGFWPGEYLFAVKTSQMDKTGKKVGHVIRSFQVVLEDSNAAGITIGNPINNVNSKVFVAQGKVRSIKVWAEGGSNLITWQAYCDKNLASSVSFNQYDSTANSKFYKVGALAINATSVILRDNPYIITLRVESITNGIQVFRDINFLFFTKDVDLPPVINTPTLVTAVEPNRLNEVVVYPSPFYSTINLKSHNPMEIISYDIVDSMGRLVHESKLYESDVFDAAHLPRGLYIVRLNSNGFNRCVKIVRE